MEKRLVSWLAVALAWTGVLSVAAAAEPLTFEKHVRPILKAHCFHCHGEEEHEGNLDLRLVRLMKQGGDSGPAILPGQAGQSLLVERIEAREMPPEGKGKGLSAQELATLRAWIDGGAALARPEPAALAAVTDDEKEFWSFRPLAAAPLPAVQSGDLLRSPIDAFLLHRLEQEGLSFSPLADRSTLVRRTFLDLVGLPPSPDQAAQFAADRAPDAFERLLDRLLAMPQYGERWGRHWLDVAGYADSDGYTERDPERKYAYKYRDYVIRALNADKPWDRFVIEQLAGDELLAPPYADLSPAQADLLAATGFLRMAPDGTADKGVDQKTARNDVVAETLKIVSSSLLGLTVGCAQCHNHRYDPIPQTDYYRWRAIFEPAFDCENWRPPQARLVSLWSKEVRERAEAIDAELKKLSDERQAELDKIVDAIFEAEVAKLDSEQQGLARAARMAEPGSRTPEQQQILKDHPSLNVSRGSAYLYDRKRVDAMNKEYDERTKAVQARRPPEDYVPCLTEVPGRAPDTFVFYRGDFNQPRDRVAPGELTVLAAGCGPLPADDPALPTTGRRLAYARWLTSGKQPLVPRVLVNRFWMHHFGTGIVATPGDFGFLGARPTHPELLDWLAVRFISDGWELKRLHRLLMSSTAYQQSSRRSAAQDRVDPDNHLLGRMPVRRLEAEAVRDAILAAAGNLELSMLGPPVPVTVDEVGQVIVGADNRDSAGRPQGKRGSLGAVEFRRSVYVQVRRSLPLSMLEAFDAPQLNPNCEQRNRSTVAPQSLLLMNNEFVLAQAVALAERARAGASDRAEQVRTAWRYALAAEPTEAQVAAAVEFLAAQEGELAAAVPSANKSDKSQSLDPAVGALASLCQALYSSNAFLYVD